MIHRPSFPPHCVAVAVEDDAVLLLSERKQILLRGPLLPRLAARMDGIRTADDLVAELSSSAAPADVREALAALERKGYLVEGTAASPAEAAFWSLQGIDPAAAAARLEGGAVALTTIGVVDPAPFVEALGEWRIGVAPDAALTIVLTDDSLRPQLGAINARMLASGKPWLLAKPIGAELWIGPLFRPPETACWRCLEPRLLGNRGVELFAAGQASTDGAPLVVARAVTAASIGIAARLVATEAARWLAGGGGALENELVSFDLLTLGSARHTVVRRPQCEACGTADRASLSRAGLPIVLAAGEAVHREGGQHAASPEATVERYRHLVSPITGWVSRLERAGTAGDGAHVYFAGHNFSRQATGSLEALRTSLRSHSSGKGRSDAQAKASGLCEALERASGVFDDSEPRRRARIAELGEYAVPPNELLLYSERQYRERGGAGARSRVPMPFDEGRAIDWTPAWSLTRGQVRYLPTALCYYAYPWPDEHRFGEADSNGCAAGNTLEEAILQGFFELVERDAVAIWWYNRLPRPPFFAAAVDPYLQQQTEWLRRLGRELWLLDLTSDFGIPVCAAVSRRMPGAEGDAEAILLGFGAHWDPRIAAERALTELQQMVAWTLPARARRDPLTDPSTLRWLRTATVAGHPHLAPQPGARGAAADAEPWSNDFRENVLRCVAAAGARGLEVIVLDQTRPDIGLPVAKVVVPGLRHFWARLAPGRLYDVPVTLGWLPRRNAEEELNPVELIL